MAHTSCFDLSVICALVKGTLFGFPDLGFCQTFPISDFSLLKTLADNSSSFAKLLFLDKRAPAPGTLRTFSTQLVFQPERKFADLYSSCLILLFQARTNNIPDAIFSEAWEMLTE